MTNLKGTNTTNHFPWKLHDMLDEADDLNHSHIISWCADGKSFRIHKPSEMVSVLTRYFRQTKYKSLLRQLQGYDFKRVTSGNEKGNVSHPLFQQGHRSLCKDMKRKTNKLVPKKDPESKTRTKPLRKTNSKLKSKIDQPRDITSSGLISDHTIDPKIARNFSQKERPKPSPAMSNGFVKPSQVASSDSLLKSPLEELENNFKFTFKNSLTQGKNQHKATTILPAPEQSFKSTGMDSLRVEIGCTFSAPEGKAGRSVSIGTKRNAPQQYPLHGIGQSSASAPTLENPRLSKRRRAFHSEDLSSPFGNAQTSFKNASFSFNASQQPPIDDILEQEKMEFQKKQKARQFEQLEKLCFSNVSRPGMQQFQHSLRSNSAVGTMDLDISLTTTTTTTNENGDSHMSTSTVSNKFILPSQLEPTPILSPTKANNVTNAISLDISFPSAEPSDKLNFPPPQVSQANISLEGNSNHSISEVSDEIDEGIAEAFEDDGDDNKWATATFDSDIEEDQNDNKDEEQDDWTKGIVYEGKTDCVLEPEKFQKEVQTMLSSSQPIMYSKYLSHPGVLQHLQPQDNVIVQQLRLQSQHRMMQQQPPTLQQIPVPVRRVSANNQTQRIPMGVPYALLSRPMAFQRPFPS